jgi:mRNA-degrading endonuclease toxin of MazEF toxin-antitoxin module
LLIRANSPEGKQAGLIMDSAISCENLFTIRQDAVIRKLGRLPDDLMQQVNECLRAALGIS